MDDGPVRGVRVSGQGAVEGVALGEGEPIPIDLCGGRTGPGPGAETRVRRGVSFDVGVHGDREVVGLTGGKARRGEHGTGSCRGLQHEGVPGAAGSTVEDLEGGHTHQLVRRDHAGGDDLGEHSGGTGGHVGDVDGPDVRIAHERVGLLVEVDPDGVPTGAQDVVEAARTHAPTVIEHDSADGGHVEGGDVVAGHGLRNDGTGGTGIVVPLDVSPHVARVVAVRLAQGGRGHETGHLEG